MFMEIQEYLIMKIQPYMLMENQQLIYFGHSRLKAGSAGGVTFIGVGCGFG